MQRCRIAGRGLALCGGGLAVGEAEAEATRLLAPWRPEQVFTWEAGLRGGRSETLRYPAGVWLCVFSKRF